MKILIIRFSSIGDIILTSPIIRCLKQQIPDAEIHYLCKDIYSGLLINNIYIDKVHSFKDSLAEIIPQLKEEKYDLIVDLHKNIRSFIVKLNLKTKYYSFNKINIRKWLYVNFKINLMPDVHIVDRYFNTVSKLNIQNDGKGLDYFIPEDEQVGTGDFPINFHKEYAVMVIGGKHFTKQIPDYKIIEICKTTSIPIILVGGKEDREKAENIRKSAENRDIFNACGIFTINQSASVIENAKVIITPDTGMMHIASAFNKKIISVWGNTVPEFGFYPYNGQMNGSEIIEIKNLKCRPCSKIGYAKCPKKHFDCMNKIDTSLIKKHLQ